MSDVDPKEAIEEKCKESKGCLPLLEELERCSQRVEGKPGTAETCVQELFQLRSCLDACVRRYYLFVAMIINDVVDIKAAI